MSRPAVDIDNRIFDPTRWDSIRNPMSVWRLRNHNPIAIRGGRSEQ